MAVLKVGHETSWPSGLFLPGSRKGVPGKCDCGAKKPGQNAGIDGMTDHGKERFKEPEHSRPPGAVVAVKLFAGV
jgi:hypothetical protein